MARRTKTADLKLSIIAIFEPIDKTTATATRTYLTSLVG